MQKKKFMFIKRVLFYKVKKKKVKRIFKKKMREANKNCNAIREI